MSRILLCFLSVHVSFGALQAAPNPYCVSGANWDAGGTMARLNMPADSLGYIWDTLQPSNLANMVRPCRYWELVGVGHRAHGYHEADDTIHDPTAFGQWVDANKSKVWIIGNEPNIYPQDGLSPAQYARMFHTYYEFIRLRDPSARFAVAGLAGDATGAGFADNRQWWNEVLAEYRTRFGMDLPADIWNCHGYRMVGSLDPDETIAEYFAPYREFVDTVSGGIYAGKELWITEFGVPTWSVALDPVLVAEVIAQLCPRLERAGLGRFFWFIGPWPGNWDQALVDTALVGADGVPTVPGQIYSSLANSYPNPLPPPFPSQLPAPSPPLRVSNDFSVSADPLEVQGGDWHVADGAYRQTRTNGGWGLLSRMPYEYRDVRVEVDLRINSPGDSAEASWVGVSVRLGDIWKSRDLGTYLVYFRQNGELGIYTAADQQVLAVPAAVSDPLAYRHMAVEMIDWTIEISIDGVKRATWTDPNHRRASGAVAVYSGKTDCSFDNLVVTALMPADLDIDGDVDQSDFGLFQACYSGPGQTQDRPSCRRSRMDEDDDVDQDDFMIFQGCMSGADVVADPACAQ